MKSFVPESVKLFTLIILFFVVLIYLSEVLDIVTPKEYNCSQVEQYLIGGWHPDIPKEVIEQCRKLKQEKYHAKTI
jgi:hypothetical protein